MVSAEMLKSMNADNEENLLDLSFQKPVLLVFLRHFGCIFCREALTDIARNRTGLESKGVQIILVHMSDYETAEGYFKDFGLLGIRHISDPACQFYSHFGLTKGNFNQLFGLKSWTRGFSIAVGDGIFPALKQIGDGFQMPGVFLIEKGDVKEQFIHKSAADRPDYSSLIKCCVV